MKINCSQNYYYQTANNTNMVKQQKSPAFKELHFSGPLMNFFREIKYPADKLMTAKTNTKKLSSRFFLEWLGKLEDKMYHDSEYFDNRYDIVAKVCKDVSIELFKYDEVKAVLELARHKDVKEIAEKHVNNFEKEAKKIFEESGQDFDFNIYKGGEKYRDAKPNEVKFEVPGLGYGNFGLEYWGKDYENNIDLNLSALESGQTNFFKRDLCDEASEPVKELNTVYQLVKEEYENELHTKIKSLAEPLAKEDEYLRLQ